MNEIAVDPCYATMDHALTEDQAPVDNRTYAFSGSQSSMTLASSTHNGQGGPRDVGSGIGSAMDEEESCYTCPAVDWRAIKDGVSVCHIPPPRKTRPCISILFFLPIITVGHQIPAHLLDFANIKPCPQRPDCHYCGGSGDHRARDDFAATPSGDDSKSHGLFRAVRDFFFQTLDRLLLYFYPGRSLCRWLIMGCGTSISSLALSKNDFIVAKVDTSLVTFFGRGVPILRSLDPHHF